MRKKGSIFFLVNSFEEFSFSEELESIFPGGAYDVTVGSSLPASAAEYSLIVLWSYRKILPGLEDLSNVLVFHSTDLPRGRGWAPLYHTIVLDSDSYTITGFKPTARADEGDIVARVRMPLRPEYTASFLRRLDHILTLRLALLVMERYPDGNIQGKPQHGEATHFPKRNPSQNKVELTSPLGDIVMHLRACEKSHPAFFEWRGIEYVISVEPRIRPELPREVQAELFTEGRFTTVILNLSAPNHT